MANVAASDLTTSGAGYTLIPQQLDPTTMR